MTENNQSLNILCLDKNEFLVANGIPNPLPIWSIILEYTLEYTSKMPQICQSCKIAHDGDGRKKVNKLVYLRSLLTICRTFNNLPALRAYFHPISRFHEINTMKSTTPLNWQVRGSWTSQVYSYVSVINLKSKPEKKVSNRISHLTWITTNGLKGMVKWEYGKKLPIFFIAHLNHLITEEGEVFPELKIPMFSYLYDNTPNAEYTFRHEIPKMIWKKTLYKPKDGDQPKLNAVKGKYHLLVLGSPYNLFEIDNMNYFQTQKVEPIGRINGKKVCFLVYQIRSLWRYRIFTKTDTIGKYPIYFRTNIL